MDARERHIAVPKTARYWTLGDASSAEEVWFTLHGYKQLARRFLRRFEGIADGSRYVVAPEGLSRFYVSTESGRHGSSSIVGATWMTREDRETEIADYVGYLDRLASEVRSERSAHPEVESERPAPNDDVGRGPTVLGFSQGVATATRWVTLGSMRPRRLVLWGDFTPPDLPMERAAEALAGVDVVMVRGREDRALSPRLAEEEEERLRAAGIQYRTVEYDGGHEIDPEVLLGLADEG